VRLLRLTASSAEALLLIGVVLRSDAVGGYPNAVLTHMAAFQASFEPPASNENHR
jgi:hypothetical protein